MAELCEFFCAHSQFKMMLWPHLSWELQPCKHTALTPSGCTDWHTHTHANTHLNSAEHTHPCATHKHSPVPEKSECPLVLLALPLPCVCLPQYFISYNSQVVSDNLVSVDQTDDQLRSKMMNRRHDYKILNIKKGFPFFFLSFFFLTYPKKECLHRFLQNMFFSFLFWTFSLCKAFFGITSQPWIMLKIIVLQLSLLPVPFPSLCCTALHCFHKKILKHSHSPLHTGFWSLRTQGFFNQSFDWILCHPQHSHTRKYTSVVDR